MPFVKGQSGNPNGRKPGTITEGSKVVKEFLTARAPELIAKCFERAMVDNDPMCMRLCIERLAPAMKDWPKDEEGRLIPLILAINHVAEAVSDEPEE